MLSSLAALLKMKKMSQHSYLPSARSTLSADSCMLTQPRLNVKQMIQYFLREFTADSIQPDLHPEETVQLCTASRFSSHIVSAIICPAFAASSSVVS